MRRLLLSNAWRRILASHHVSQPTKLLCTSTNNSNKVPGQASSSIRDLDAYRQLEKLDFMTAAKILFTTPPKKKKFGLDFHLVQLFFACMPSLAVYLVAQYARYEIKRMEAEVEVKKKEEEEVKAKEMEAIALEEIEKVNSNPELVKVKVRLEALEEAVKEITVGSKKQSTGSLTKDEEGTKAEMPERLKSECKSESSSSTVESSPSVSRPSSVIDASIPDRSNGVGSSEGVKK